jgi:hypothetical protein
MTLSTAQQTALEGASARGVYFLELRFKTATMYLCTANQTINWNSKDWVGMAGVSDISAIQESDGLDAKALDFTLNAAKLEWTALSVGSVEEYRGRDAILYFCPLDDQFRLVGTPQRCWSGVMQILSSGIDNDGKGKIQLRCEGAAYGFKRRAAMRMNAAQQKQRYPTDTGFDYVEDLLATPATWLSKRFQQI